MILIEIERILVNQKGEYSFLIVDSMTSMKSFFTSSQISEFFRYLLSRMLEEEMKVIVFDQDSQKDDETVGKVSSVMDGLVDLSGEVD
jgi:archaellum biogenesis ATPase FlaH